MGESHKNGKELKVRHFKRFVILLHGLTLSIVSYIQFVHLGRIIPPPLACYLSYRFRCNMQWQIHRSQTDSKVFCLSADGLLHSFNFITLIFLGQGLFNVESSVDFLSIWF
jgi:hypothetical protein